MTTPTWQEATTPITQPEYVDLELAALETAGSKLNGWSADAPQRALVEGEATALAAGSDNIAALAKTASPTTASDAGASWVDAVMGWFDIEREPATYAVWDLPCIVDLPAIPLTVDGTNAGQIQAQADGGQIFLCTQESAVNFTLASSREGTLRFTARVAGDAGGNVTPGAIRKFIAAPSGLTLTEATQVPVVTARDQETDAAFIQRGLGRWGVIGPSTDSALGSAGWTRTSLDYLIPFFGNTATTSVTRWAVDDANPFGPGTVLVTLADAAGPATTDTIDAVTAGLNGLSVKPVGSGEITVQGATTFVVAIVATIQTDGTVSDTVTKAAAEAALERLGSVFPLHGKLTPSLVNTILMGAALQTVSVQTGTTDVQVQLDLPGFAGVEYIVTSDFTSDANLGFTDVLVLTSTITALV